MHRTGVLLQMFETVELLKWLSLFEIYTSIGLLIICKRIHVCQTSYINDTNCTHLWLKILMHILCTCTMPP